MKLFKMPGIYLQSFIEIMTNAFLSCVAMIEFCTLRFLPGPGPFNSLLIESHCAENYIFFFHLFISARLKVGLRTAQRHSIRFSVWFFKTHSHLQLAIAFSFVSPLCRHLGPFVLPAQWTAATKRLETN